MNATVLFKQSLTMTGYIETLQDVKILKASRVTKQLEGEEVGDIKIECYLSEKSVKKTITLNGFLINEANKLIDFIQEFINDFIYHNLEPQFILDIQDSVNDTKMKVSPMWTDKSIQNDKVKEVTFIKESKGWKEYQTLETFDKSERDVFYGTPVVMTKENIINNPLQLNRFIDTIVNFCKFAKKSILETKTAWNGNYRAFIDLLLFLKDNLKVEKKEIFNVYYDLLLDNEDVYNLSAGMIAELVQPTLDKLNNELQFRMRAEHIKSRAS